MIHKTTLAIRNALILFGALAAVSAVPAFAQRSEHTGPPPTRVQMVSALPEAITYYDEGSGDAVREKKEVAVTTTSLVGLATNTLIRTLAEHGIKVVTVPPSLAAPVPKKRIDELVRGLPAQDDAEALIVIGPGTASTQKSIKGMAVVTKAGLPEADRQTIVFAMPQIEVYTKNSTKPCTTFGAARSRKIPAIYATWSADMANGPREQEHRDMVDLVAHELPLAIEEGVAGATDRIAACLKSKSLPHDSGDAKHGG